MAELRPNRTVGTTPAPVAGPPPPLVAVRGLVKHFPVLRGFFRRQVGSVRAVDDISFDIPDRATVAMVGESGCGKTTAGRAILRLVEPDAGQVLMAGGDVLKLDAHALRAARRHMQIVFQDPFSSLNPRQTVGQIIGRPMVLHGLCKPADMEDAARDMLRKVGLQPQYVSRYAHEFSGGQRQRVGIARAIAVRPELVVLDEAVSALDVSVRAQVLNLLLDLKNELGLSYLFVTHDLSVVQHIADRVLVMYLGQIVEQAGRERLFSRPCHPYTQALLSAAPDPHPARRKTRILLKGDVPSPINPPSGCRFHTRCPLVHDRCRVEVPKVHDLGEGQRVACHLYEGRTEPVRIG